MALDLFKLFGTIEVDNSKANQALDETGETGRRAESKLSKALSTVGKGAAIAGKAIVTGLAVGGAAMVGLTTKAVSLAGELEQNMGGSEAVFGKFADSIQTKAKEAFSQMGLSTSDYLATANKMGALFQGAGFDIEESMNLSSSAMQRAADVASIMGIDTTDAMEAIAGAAKGNFTMMDNLGVAMNDTTIQAYALEKGINKSTAEMTNQEKIGLAMEMFMEKTAYAAGNYAKENETLAGALSTAKAALTNFLDGSGDVDSFVDSCVHAAEVITDNVQVILPRLITGLTQIGKKLLPHIPPMLKSLLPGVIEGAVALLVGLAQILPDIALVLVEQVPVIIGQIKDALVEQFPQLEEPFKKIGEFFETAYSGAVDLIDSVVAGFQDAVKWAKEHETTLQFVAIAIGTLTAAIVAYNVAQAIKNAGGIVELAQLAALAVGLGALTVAETAHTVATTIATAATTAFGAVLSFITSPITLVVLAIGALIAIGVALYKNWDTIKAKCAELWSNVTSKFESLKSSVSEKVNALKTAAVNKFNELKTGAIQKFTDLKTGVVNKFNEIKNGISEKIQAAKDKVKSAIDKIKGFFSFKISWPKIPMPHFSVSPSGWKIGDLLKGKIPKLGIDWYAKAMENPIVMTKPTIWGYDPNTGNLKGGGEAGTEVVSGANTLMNMIQTAVAAQNDTLAYYLQKLIEMLSDYFPEALEAMRTPAVFDPDTAARALAGPMNRELGRITTMKGRGR